MIKKKRNLSKVEIVMKEEEKDNSGWIIHLH